MNDRNSRDYGPSLGMKRTLMVEEREAMSGAKGPRTSVGPRFFHEWDGIALKTLSVLAGKEAYGELVF